MSLAALLRAPCLPRTAMALGLAVTLTLALAAPALADRAPGEGESRRLVNRIIEARTAAKKPATLGVIRDAVEASIEFGAPAYNRGDVAACARFYQTTAQDLRAAFDSEQEASPEAHAVLETLGQALDRSTKVDSPARAAWAMRYAFDRALASWDALASHNATLMRIGDQYFRRAQFEEARHAFGDATRLLDEIGRRLPEQVPLDHRLAPVALAHAHFALGDFEAAARAIEAGLHHVPSWPSMEMDRRSFHRRAEEYDTRLAQLKLLAKKQPRSVEVQFLLGYELAMTGDRGGAIKRLKRTLRLSPRHEAARLFLDHLAKDAARPRLRRGRTAT